MSCPRCGLTNRKLIESNRYATIKTIGFEITNLWMCLSCKKKYSIQIFEPIGLNIG